MKAITVDAKFIRAAQAAQAVNDVRFYLCGICLQPGGKIAGTNGHVLYVGTYTEEESEMVDQETIIKIEGKIPVAAKDCTFIFQEDGAGFCRTDNSRAFCFSTIDARYPPLDHVLNQVKPKIEGDTFHDGFCINAEYLALLPKIFGKSVPVVSRNRTDREAVSFRADQSLERKHSLFFKTSRLIVMPMATNEKFYLATMAKDEA